MNSVQGAVASQKLKSLPNRDKKLASEEGIIDNLLQEIRTGIDLKPRQRKKSRASLTPEGASAILQLAQIEKKLMTNPQASTNKNIDTVEESQSATESKILSNDESYITLSNRHSNNESKISPPSQSDELSNQSISINHSDLTVNKANQSDKSKTNNFPYTGETDLPDTFKSVSNPNISKNQPSLTPEKQNSNIKGNIRATFTNSSSFIHSEHEQSKTGKCNILSMDDEGKLSKDFIYNSPRNKFKVDHTRSPHQAIKKSVDSQKLNINQHQSNLQAIPTLEKKALNANSKSLQNGGEHSNLKNQISLQPPSKERDKLQVSKLSVTNSKRRSSKQIIIDTRSNMAKNISASSNVKEDHDVSPKQSSEVKPTVVHLSGNNQTNVSDEQLNRPSNTDSQKLSRKSAIHITKAQPLSLSSRPQIINKDDTTTTSNNESHPFAASAFAQPDECNDDDSLNRQQESDNKSKRSKKKSKSALSFKSISKFFSVTSQKDGHRRK